MFVDNTQNIMSIEKEYILHEAGEAFQPTRIKFVYCPSLPVSVVLCEDMLDWHENVLLKRGVTKLIHIRD